MEEFYSQYLTFAQSVVSSGCKGNINIVEVQERIRALVDLVSKESDRVIRLIVANHTSENYLIAHCLNSAILSLLLGIELRYSEENLEKLGIAALLHDIGMERLFETVNRPVKLSPNDFEEVKKHPLFAVKALESLEADPEILRAIQEHHERENGSGYPQGLTENQIHKFASVIAVADVYQAMIHPRPYRDKNYPFQAIKHMVESRGIFNRLALKALLEVISIFPLETIVELNSGSIAKVVKINKGSLMSPQVEMLYNPNGKPADSAVIDLAKMPFSHIQRCFTQEELDVWLKQQVPTQKF